MLYKHTTQKPYICDPQTKLNNFFTLPKISLHVSAPTGHLQVIFLKISYSTAIHPSSWQVWGYLLLLNLYVYNAKEVFKIHNFLHYRMHIIFFCGMTKKPLLTLARRKMTGRKRRNGTARQRFVLQSPIFAPSWLASQCSRCHTYLTHSDVSSWQNELQIRYTQKCREWDWK
jgi:hypothetical protein